MTEVESNIIALFFSNYEELHVLQLFYVTYALICQSRSLLVGRAMPIFLYNRQFYNCFDLKGFHVLHEHQHFR